MSSPASTTTRVSLLAATAIVAGNMIGSGVFSGLGYQAAALPSAFLILMLWLAGGLLSFFGAVNYAELSAAFPKSGGEYQLLSQVYHPSVGFVGGWISMTAGFPAPVAFAALLIGENFCHAAGWEPGMLKPVIGASVVVAVTAAHLVSVVFSGRFQWIATGLKALLMAVVVVCGFVLPGTGHTHFLPQAGDGTLLSGQWNAVFVCLIYVLFAYSGWNAACYIAGEVEQPERNIPRALLRGTVIVTLLYLGMNAAMLYATPMTELAASGSSVAFVAARHIFGDAGARIMSGLIALGLVSTISAMTWAGPRVAQQMGRDYPQIGWLARTTPSGVPWVAVLLQGVLSLALVFTASLEEIIMRTGFLLQLPLLLTVWGVIHLRIRQPHLPRPCRAWGYPFTTVLFLIMVAFTLAWVLEARPEDSRWGMAIVITGIAFYWFARPGKKEEQV